MEEAHVPLPSAADDSDNNDGQHALCTCSGPCAGLRASDVLTSLKFPAELPALWSPTSLLCAIQHVSPLPVLLLFHLCKCVPLATQWTIWGKNVSLSCVLTLALSSQDQTAGSKWTWWNSLQTPLIYEWHLELMKGCVLDPELGTFKAWPHLILTTFPGGGQFCLYFHLVGWGSRRLCCLPKARKWSRWVLNRGVPDTPADALHH